VRLLVYTDYRYRARGRRVFGERAFVRFLNALAEQLGGMQLLGRLDEGHGPVRYELQEGIVFLALPDYPALTDLPALMRALPATLLAMWRAVGEADVVFSLGPQPPALALALIALARRRGLVLGVRQDFPAYVRHRHPRRLVLRAAAVGLEQAWRLLARRAPVIAVGAELGAHYRHAPRLLEATVSLIGEADLSAGRLASGLRDYGASELVLLSVGRLEAEKNPLLLAEILALLRAGDERWRMIVCGEGPLREPLAARLAELGVDAHAELRGYLPLHDGLLELYRTSHVFLHVSLTEGLPQTLIEAFASGLPTVATAVGGVRGLGGCSLLVPPGDAGAAAAAVARLAVEQPLRDSLIEAGFAHAGTVTLRSQAAAVSRFLAG
jgi:glycosyltransferase involved in cell wall biosynthesis